MKKCIELRQKADKPISRYQPGDSLRADKRVCTDMPRSRYQILGYWHIGCCRVISDIDTPISNIEPLASRVLSGDTGFFACSRVILGDGPMFPHASHASTTSNLRVDTGSLPHIHDTCSRLASTHAVWQPVFLHLTRSIKFRVKLNPQNPTLQLKGVVLIPKSGSPVPVPKASKARLCRKG